MTFENEQRGAEMRFHGTEVSALIRAVTCALDMGRVAQPDIVMSSDVEDQDNNVEPHFVIHHNQ